MKVNEIFYSLQGEGRFTGTAAIFLRLSGCNLRCPFCDTDHEAGKEMSDDEIVRELQKYPTKHLVITGGEPSLQIKAGFIDRLHRCGYFVQAETNGVIPLPGNIDWITCSPKYKPICYSKVDEIKCLYEGEQSEGKINRLYHEVDAQCHYLQPCDMQDPETNAGILAGCIAFIKTNPQWRLSLQTHKIIGIR